MAADPFAQLFMFWMVCIRECVQQVVVTGDAAAVFRRCWVFAGEIGLVVTSVPKVTLRNLLNINGVFDKPCHNSLKKKETCFFFNLKRDLG